MKSDAVEYARVPPTTLAITHVCDGEEVITGGHDGQTYIATFACEVAARAYIDLARTHLFAVKGERRGK